ncbi:hypothetical protein ACFQH2_09220 [Natronoarchaeum sp. GCM10025703]|uniref:hypothetical protein n=1 Tax=Natronoarchaeum sp. GCM10025703 TaxID=3252685 RepID=UPI0036216A29
MSEESVSEHDEPGADVEEIESSSVIDGFVFVTGENPNAGSFLLVVGIVTCVFIAAFQLTLPSPISEPPYCRRAGRRHHQFPARSHPRHAGLLRHAETGELSDRRIQ